MYYMQVIFLFNSGMFLFIFMIFYEFAYYRYRCYISQYLSNLRSTNDIKYIASEYMKHHIPVFELQKKIWRYNWSLRSYTHIKQLWNYRLIKIGFKSYSGLKFFQALILQLPKLCMQLQWSIMSSYLCPQVKYIIIFRIFTCILHHLQVYFNLKTWSAHSW